ncbi:MAG TPA: PAS domain S-box protein, partial [Terriglobales bacterium]|nr:PAS domain S-box protein [Terriglobales bacterium]
LIMLSSRADEEAWGEALQAGADDCVATPFMPRELLQRVASRLEIAQLRTVRSLASASEQDRRMLAAIVESSDDAIVSKDLNGIVTSWNARAEQIFGYTAEEMIGLPILTIIPPELIGDEWRILDTIARGERIEHFETERLTKSGERIEVSLTISPVKDENGRIIGAAKIARDITQRKKTERALQVTEKLASVGRLAATVAHEINNPLEAVTNLVYLAREHSVRGEVRDYLTMAEEELARIAHLTKQTLSFYREAKDPSAMTVGAVVNPLISVFASKARNKGIEVLREIRQDPQIVAVPSEVRQLVANLLSNSIDAISGGGRIRLRVSAASEWSGRRRPGVRLTVADSGPGIPRDLAARVFEPFFTTKKEVGTGLGLWVCKSIVDKHQGTMRIRSCTAPGRSGTAFSVFLPLGPASPAASSGLRKAV